MTIQDDETLQMYLEESLEHLADIENDFLAIEEAGADIDEDMVNKVYRAAHSIKGGAGFMGLTTIKDLTHEMENILGKIRSREMIPTPEIINVLLEASDTLKDLMNDVFNSNEVDISAHITALQAVAEGKMVEATSNSTAEEAESALPEEPQTTAPQPDPKTVAEDTGKTVEIVLPDGRQIFSVTNSAILEMMAEKKFIYLIEMDLTKDIQDKGKTAFAMVEEMDQTGKILISNVDIEPLQNLTQDWVPESAELFFLFATILKPDDINVLFEIDEKNIYLLNDNMALECIAAQADTDHMQVQQKHEGPVEPAAADQSQQAVEEAAQAQKEQEAVSPTTEPEVTGKQKTKPVQQKEQETSLRVHVSLLDQLMTLAGELVLSRNQLLQSMTSEDQRGFEIAGQRIDLITSELQEAIMLTRMQSIGNVFNKFPRVVRDLARSLGKNVELTLEGKEVELDKTIIEAIGDPLTHLVRNAVDHGIETPEIRSRAKKPPTGQIYLKAYHEAGQVNIEISDDGKGLDGELLARKAIEKGLITEEQAKVMSAKEKTNLIFLPGFSTAEKITDVSGRGVGMDVVKTNLDKLGGLIDIDSEPGRGSIIRIKLPLTLAIIPCQVINTGGERYAIPQVNLEELLRIPADQVKKRIERVGNAEVVRLRGNLLPLIKLADIIGVKPVFRDPETNELREDRRKSIVDRRSKKSPLFAGEESEKKEEPEFDEAQSKRESGERRYHAVSALNIVVVSTGSMKYGLVVDELHDSEEIVVKPLGRDLKACKGYAGATIMGDGRVALILDVGNLAQMAGLTSLEGSQRASELANESKKAARNQKDRQSLLIFRSAEEEQFAVPLNLVERIEKIKLGDIEELGGKRVMKYRGGSLPLFSIDEVAMVKPLADSENLLVIVFIIAGREIGLLAIGPVDAMETNLHVDGTALKQTGIMGSTIISDHTTQLVDVFEIVQALNPEWFEENDITAATDDGSAPTILFAEDSNFFRSQVKGSMEQEGYTVIEAEDGEIAWNLLQENAEEIGLVVTDIEMPNMNGFELTQKIKSDPHYSHLPIIALTTLAGEEDIAQGQQVGIDDYQIKLDREKLLKSIFEMFQAQG
jgi:two-component system chemotaxis sensor kinase CheA